MAIRSPCQFISPAAFKIAHEYVRSIYSPHTPLKCLTFCAPGCQNIRCRAFELETFPIIMKHLRFIALCLSVTILRAAAFTAEASAEEHYRWGMDRMAVVASYIPSRDFIEFKLAERPDYENKILNYIIAIDSNLSSKVTVIRGKSRPETDYLFVRGSLCSVLENYGMMPRNSFSAMMERLKTDYGNPGIQKDDTTTTYSFFSDKSKIIVLSKDRQQTVDCKVYYYASRLFRMLITD